jgi:hypothetical protein
MAGPAGQIARKARRNAKFADDYCHVSRHAEPWKTLLPSSLDGLCRKTDRPTILLAPQSGEVWLCTRALVVGQAA